MYMRLSPYTFIVKNNLHSKNREEHEKLMVKKAVEYLVQHPEVMDQVRAGKASLIGLSQIEQKAVMDVFNNPKSTRSNTMEYWS